MKKLSLEERLKPYKQRIQAANAAIRQRREARASAITRK